MIVNEIQHTRASMRAVGEGGVEGGEGVMEGGRRQHVFLKFHTDKQYRYLINITKKSINIY